MTTKLRLYNGALLLLSERKLAALTDECESRRLLDDAWDMDFVTAVLMAGQWSFAKRTQELVASSSIVPPFGHGKAYEIPEDFVRLIAFCSDPYLSSPITAYDIEDGCFLTDVEPIYVSYVSNDPTYGGDMSKWPPEFCSYCHAWLAEKIAMKLTHSEAMQKLAEAKKKEYLAQAANGNAMDQPAKFPPTGSFLRARTRGGAVRRDRGYRNKLMG